MKANELMIDDWVEQVQDLVPFAPIKIEEIKRECVIFGNGLCKLNFNEINPIPLTAEILEKNGFKHSMPHNDWTNADCNFYLYEGGNGYRIQNTDIKLDYVHQLQHALRLCNIEKEIEL